MADGVVFGLAHFELLELLGLAAFGVVLALMAYQFKRLGPGIFAHATFNLLAILCGGHPALTGIRPSATGFPGVGLRPQQPKRDSSTP